MAALAAWLVLTFVGLVRAAGGAVPYAAELASAVVATPIALVAAGCAVAALWRGPTIVSFGLADSIPCGAAEAAHVRAHAQLRGTMGGAGFLYPRRLLLAAAAWAAAGAVGLSGFSESLCDLVGPWALAAALGSAFAAFLFPARPYFYRDTTGGGAVLSPPSAAYRLKRRAQIAESVARGETPEAPTPAPTPAPSPLTPSQVAPRHPGA